MMNFIEVVREAGVNGKIRKKSWKDGEHIVVRRTMIFQGGEFASWCFETDSILTDDWEVVPDPPKTMGWDEARKLLQDNKTLTRVAWHNVSIKTGSFGCMFLKSFDTYSGFFPTVEDINATDWIEVEEEQR